MRALPKYGVAVGVGLLAVGYGIPGLAQDGRWDSRIGAALSVTATDNVCLENGGDKVGWVSSFTPRAAISRKTRQSALNVSGSVQMHSLTNSVLKSKGCRGNYDDRDQYNPQLEARYKRDIVPKTFSVTVRGRIRQNEVSSRFRPADEFNRSANTNTYYRYWVQPTFRRRLGGNLNMRLGYTWDDLYNSSELLVDSRRHRVDARFSTAGASKWSQYITARHNITMFGENRNGRTKADQEYGSANYGLGYTFSRKFAVNGSVGWDWSNFRSGRNNNTGGFAWQAGVSWTPSPRTSVRLGTGDRFFGNTPSVDISHKQKRSQFTLSYDKTLRFGRDVRTSNIGGFPGGLPNTNNPSIYTNDPIIDERVRGGWVYTGVRTNLILTGNYSDQRRREGGEPYVFKSLSFTVAPNLSTRYGLSGSVMWQEDEPRGIDIEEFPINTADKSTLWTYSLNLTRVFSESISTALILRHRTRDGTTSQGDYDENSITATVSFTF